MEILNILVQLPPLTVRGREKQKSAFSVKETM
jgi:hypothetical protein